jgi:5S rRNA maturation endonuclease (ribonuclease M5)
MAILVATNKPSGVLSLAELEALDAGTSPTATERRFVCPLCDDRPRQGDRRVLSLNTITGLWICYRCDGRGKLREWWEDRPLLPRREQARARLRAAFALPSPVEPDHDPDDAEWRAWAASAVPLADTRGARYLAGRGIPLDLAGGAGVVYVRRWYGRPGVVYPLRDQDGALAAVGVRYVDGCSDPKTRVGGRLKYGAFTMTGAFSGDTVVIVEGPADALSMALCGVSAVALHRTSAPDWVIKRCALKRVLVALDADEGGDKGAAKMIPELESYGATVTRLRPWRKDWNDVLTLDGADYLRRVLFDAIAAPQWAAAWRAHRRNPDADLAAAIDSADLPAFREQLARYQGISLPTNTAAPVPPGPEQLEMIP